MDFVFGGAYQGKLDFVKETYSVKEEEIYTCRRENGAGFCLSARVIVHLEEFVLACVRAETEAAEYLKAHRETLADKILICNDISQGVVPVERELREWREMTGRTMNYLAGEAESVTRIFCGLPQKLK